MQIKAHSQLSYLRENICGIASTSQPLWHPLGFVSCVIREAPKEFIVRIHYWPRFERRTKNPDWPIHTHAYHLSSYILEGRIRDQQYRLKKGTNHEIYAVSYSGKNSMISPTNERTGLEKVVDTVREQGEEYAISIGSFHRSLVPVEESAISLVVLSNFVTANPLVLGTPGKKSYPYDRVEFDRTVFWNRISEVI